MAEAAAANGWLDRRARDARNAHLDPTAGASVILTLLGHEAARLLRARY